VLQPVGEEKREGESLIFRNERCFRSIVVGIDDAVTDDDDDDDGRSETEAKRGCSEM
jgi:hypothetical protein